MAMAAQPNISLDAPFSPMRKWKRAASSQQIFTAPVPNSALRTCAAGCVLRVAGH
jgi:hypothetical protein